MSRHMDTIRHRARMIKEWKTWTPRIAEAARETLPDAQVFIFGSIVRGNHTAGSDVDILIVSEALPERALERAELKVKMENASKLPVSHPFEIHLATPSEAEAYLRRAGKHALKL